ncbi:MAG: uncharacterized protein JWM90_2518 [Thermoleophilia bacterium]|nr:uncharacterized protein [Thermoleophilia bacterium]
MAARAPQSAFTLGSTGTDATSETVTMYRVVGPRERALLEADDWRRLPRRADWSVILVKLVEEGDAFDTVHHHRARRAAATPLSVVEVQVRRDFAESLRVELPDRLAGRTEYWVEAQRLDEFNANIVGPIRQL